MLNPNLMKRQVLFDSREVRLVNQPGFAELALALGALGSQKVALRRMSAQNLAGASHFKALGHGFLRLATCY